MAHWRVPRPTPRCPRCSTTASDSTTNTAAATSGEGCAGVRLDLRFSTRPNDACHCVWKNIVVRPSDSSAPERAGAIKWVRERSNGSSLFDLTLTKNKSKVPNQSKVPGLFNTMFRRIQRTSLNTELCQKKSRFGLSAWAHAPSTLKGIQKIF